MFFNEKQKEDAKFCEILDCKLSDIAEFKSEK